MELKPCHMTQIHDADAQRLLLEASLKPGETIVCTNATVIADTNGSISWIDNSVPICWV